MQHGFVSLLLLFALPYSGLPASSSGPVNEQLNYSINWPSGLSLGESHLSAAAGTSSADAPSRLQMEFDIDASVPGFQVLDRYHADATSDYCSTGFEKKIKHGSKSTEEKTRFDQQAHSAKRETVGGGKSEMDISSCGKDALTFLYYVRHELSQGRLPAPQTVYFGASYQIRLEFEGTQTTRIGDANVETDRFKATAKGPSSEISFEIFFLKDATRTPALVHVPLALGTFSMELVK